MSNTRILVGMPAGRDIPVLTARSLLEWRGKGKATSLFMFKLDTYIEKARNELVWNAVNEKATHLMMIDSDMVFPPDGIDKLLAHDVDIVGGLYYGRMHPKAMAFYKNGDGTVSNFDPKTKPGLHEVDFVATGFMLINMNVFKKLEPPFFTFTYNPEFFGLNNQGMLTPTGEDSYFCLSAKAAGFKVYVDNTITLGHVGERMYTKRDWEKYQDDKDFYENIRV